MMTNLTSESLILMLRDLAILNDYDDYDDEEFCVMRFHGARRNYGRVRHHCHYTDK